MSYKRAFTEQSRQQVVRSNVNRSVSKQLWSFSKRKRFDSIKTQCPVAFYQQDYSTISNKKVRFTGSNRKLFTQISDAPLPGTYQQLKEKVKNIPLFGESRERCLFSSYIPRQIAQNPGPNKYEGQAIRKKKGFTMRPKTANHRNYFIEDKEKVGAPGPFDYTISIERQGKAASSKFRTTFLGNSGLQKTQPRFQTLGLVTPSPSAYYPKSVGLKSECRGGSIGSQIRQSFIDALNKKQIPTGPGNYELPTQFGHYIKTSSSPTHRV